MSILILGSTGTLGSELLKELNRKEVRAFGKPDLDLLKVSAKKLDQIISSYDMIVNCSVSKNTERLSHMFHLNTVVPTYIAEKVNKRRKKSAFIQISTDYVFDGVGGTGQQPYQEILPMYPQFHLMPEYSFTKFMAENNVLLFNGYIIRTSFYPNEPVTKAPSNKLTSAMYVDEIAKKIVRVIDGFDVIEKDPNHILHVGNGFPRTAFEVVQQRNHDVGALQLERDYDFSLNTERYYKVFEDGKV